MKGEEKLTADALISFETKVIHLTVCASKILKKSYKKSYISYTWLINVEN